MQELQGQINKRMTLNLLIQGSAEHAFLTSHYIVTDELNALHPALLKLYDQFALGAFLTSWIGVNALIHGKPDRFWKRIHDAEHPFSNHPLLRRHGPALADAARDHVEARARQKGVTLTPGLFSLQVMRNYSRIASLEKPRITRLEEIAKHATRTIWGIDIGRLDANITRDIAFGMLRKPDTVQAQLLRSSAVGYGGVLKSPGGFRVVARGVVWPLLSHELVKAVMELICLHGLNRLERSIYLRVLAAADKIEFEPWMIQAGSELWRRFLAVHPADAHLATTVMHIARLPPPELETLMFAIVEDAERAKGMIERLGQAAQREE
ncbi:MAG: hypothetical protein ACR2IE_19150 [Candidatus Sumerlaeaceae bacterium]